MKKLKEQISIIKPQDQMQKQQVVICYISSNRKDAKVFYA